MTTMDDAIDKASEQITAVFNAATKASWEAGRITGLESAAIKARDIAARAKSEQGRAACEAVAKGIEEMR
jgi:ethanolamine utilization microcompartment shell protein EutL